MQIHELNNFTGTLGSGSYLAIDDGNDTGKISSQGLLAATCHYLTDLKNHLSQ